MNATQASALVSSFLASWQNRDIEQILEFLAKDAVYHNVPVAPIVGRDAIRGIFQAFLDTFAFASLDVITMAAAPDLVLAERMDRFVLNDGRKVELPVTGVFELLGAIGLLVPQTLPLATYGLIALLVAMFPANVHAAREGLMVAGRRATPLLWRLPLQVFWIAALWSVRRWPV